MTKNILLTILITAVLGFSIAAIAEDEADTDQPQTEIILTDFNLEKPKKEEGGLEQISLYGPFSIHSLPPDVQQKILRGFDDSGQPTGATLVRQQLTESKVATENKSNIDVIFQQQRSDVDRLVRAVRENNVGGWNVNVKRRNGGVMIYFKKKF